jgi:hypothetical protein
VSEFKALPLSKLSFTNTRVSDLSPMKGMPLKGLRIDYRADREEFVRSIRGLESINDKPVAEFWKDLTAPEGWVEWQVGLTDADLEHLEFYDEAAVLTTMTPRYGRRRGASASWGTSHTGSGSG